MTQKFGMKGVKSPRLMPAGLGRRQCNSSTRKYWSIVLICIMVSWWSLSLSCNIEVAKVGTWRNDGRTESEFQKIANKIGSLDRFWTISHCCSCCSSPSCLKTWDVRIPWLLKELPSPLAVFSSSEDPGPWIFVEARFFLAPLFLWPACLRDFQGGISKEHESEDPTHEKNKT